MITVYIASKMDHAPAWRDLYSAYSDVHIVSRWPFLEPFIEPTKENARKFWVDDVRDIQSADAVIVFALPDEHLRGALVEAGIAIGLGKPVILVGEHPDYGTWCHHPLVSIAPSISAAFNSVRMIKGDDCG